ncbi:MAG: dioxygenase [Alphaproteobacteria bacterium HGW-Alphaproteobacteria-18]|nr:MAG: dioxygenase [Alphaproteobacteria bacterium HGW-Alphaproteobacteria-18]
MTAPIFVSHGSPTLIFDDVPARDFLIELGKALPRPKAILVASAHWETPEAHVTASPAPPTIHDFGGFPEAMYTQQYPAPGEPALAARVKALLEKAGIPATLDPARGLDHGAWVPLKLAWPQADIPVLQLSLQTHLGPAHHLKLGQALRPLAEEGVLILGSGSLTHDLRSVSWHGPNTEPDWVKSFGDWVNTALAEGRIDDLVNYRQLAPNAARNHPSEEHFLPLFVALGAAGPGAQMERLHTSVTFSVLRMDVFEFAG